MRYSEELQKKIKELSEKGYSSRKIAKKLTVSKSGVNDFLSRGSLFYNENSNTVKSPDILYLDIETAPCIAAVFGRFNINLSPANIIENGGQIISACWSWNEEEEVQGVVMTPEEATQRDDFRVLAELLEAMENADLICYQNGDKFDLPKIKTRCIANELFPPKVSKTIDTLKIAKQLGFPSNRLDALGDYLGVGRKQQNSGISLWIDCLKGDSKALQEMLEYNKQDVILLRDVYKKIRAFDMRHPNMQHYYNDDKVRCTVCGSTNLKETGHSVYTQVSEYEELQCNSCGHRMRKRKNVKTKQQMQNTLMNVQG